jgi:hypothetical protein
MPATSGSPCQQTQYFLVLFDGQAADGFEIGGLQALLHAGRRVDLMALQDIEGIQYGFPPYCSRGYRDSSIFSHCFKDIPSGGPPVPLGNDATCTFRNQRAS